MSTYSASALKDRIDALELALPLLAEKDRAFAQDLISGKWGFRTKGTLSPKQAVWVDTLIGRALAPATEKPAPAQIGNFQKVYEIFATASKKLKYPKIKLVVGECPVVLSVAGAKSSQPGVVNVTDGGPFGANRFYGRVQKDGSFSTGKQYDELSQVQSLLKSLAADPLGTMGEYGKLTGCCAMCNKVLSDPQSVAAGFGETCAKHWGLWKQYKEAVPLDQAA